MEQQGAGCQRDVSALLVLLLLLLLLPVMLLACGMCAFKVIVQ